MQWHVGYFPEAIKSLKVSSRRYYMETSLDQPLKHPMVSRRHRSGANNFVRKECAVNKYKCKLEVRTCAHRL